MLELTPLDFIDYGKGKERNISYDIFMLILAAVLFFQKQTIGGWIVLAVWLIPKVISFIFPEFAESRFVRIVIGIAIIASMIFVLIKISDLLIK
jgi:hypothetical protein